MRLIPAIDLIEGRCVRLERGDYARQKTYSADPLEVAKSFEDHGLKFLHLVDLDGAKSGKVVNWKVLERISTQTQLWVDFGGGVKSEEDLKIVLDSGAKQINIGSLAVKHPDLFLRWISNHGGDKIILSADVRDENVAISGWQEQTDLPVVGFIERYMEAGIKTAVVTDIAKDGMLQGPSFELYQHILKQLPKLNLVASGGITTLDDLNMLAKQGLDAAIIGKAIYEGKISLTQLENWSPE